MNTFLKKLIFLDSFSIIKDNIIKNKKYCKFHIEIELYKS